MSETQATEPTQEQVEGFTRWVVKGVEDSGHPMSVFEWRLGYAGEFLKLCESIIRRRRLLPHELPEDVYVCLGVLRKPHPIPRVNLLGQVARFYYRNLRGRSGPF